jgi:sortase (surface protein transpeptidase)
MGADVDFGIFEPRIAQMLGRAVVLSLCVLAAISPDAAFHRTAPAVVAAVPGQAPARLPAAPPSDEPSAVNTSPSRLLIPRIGVNASIEARGLDAGRNMETPNDFHNVAWYDLGPTPGAPGNALINGHVDWWTGAAVFTRLRELRAGDTVIVLRGDGTRLSFRVTGRTTVSAGARVASLFAPSPVARLTLITCAGVWDPRILTDTQRLLVSAVLA